MIRSGDNRQGVCPLKFLQEVWHDTGHDLEFQPPSSNTMVVPVTIECNPLNLEDSVFTCQPSTPSSESNSKISDTVIGNLKNSTPVVTHYPLQTYNPPPRSHVFNLESCLAKYRKPKIFDYSGPSRHYSFNSGNLNSFCGNRGILSSYFASRIHQSDKSRTSQIVQERFSRVDINKSEYTTETQEIIKKSTYKTDRKSFKKLPILSSARPLGLNFSTPKRMVSMIGHRKISNSQERPLLMGYQTDPDEYEHASFEIIPNKNGLKISPVTASTHANNFNTKYSSRNKFTSHSRPLLFMKP